MTQIFTYALIKRKDGLENFNRFRKFIIKLNRVPIAFCDWHYRPKNSGGDAWRFRFIGRHGVLTQYHEHKDFKKALDSFKNLVITELKSGVEIKFPDIDLK